MNATLERPLMLWQCALSHPTAGIDGIHLSLQFFLETAFHLIKCTVFCSRGKLLLLTSQHSVLVIYFGLFIFIYLFLVYFPWACFFHSIRRQNQSWNKTVIILLLVRSDKYHSSLHKYGEKKSTEDVKQHRLFGTEWLDDSKWIGKEVEGNSDGLI